MPGAVVVNILLIQIDGKLPNLALMRIAAHHRERGDHIDLRHGSDFGGLFDEQFDRIYASTLFERSRPLACQVLSTYPDAIIGGTGWDRSRRLEDVGITSTNMDYSIYPDYRQSIGFAMRGCRLRCPFCVVPAKEGHARPNATIVEIWRGEPWPREIVLLDNDFFGNSEWRERLREIRDGRFKVCFTQGINARLLTREQAEAIACVDYRDSKMVQRRLYTAWDNTRDEAWLFAGLELLCRNGVRPRHLLVYMLIGFAPGETHEDRDYRRRKLREYGALPYPMPYRRTPELVGFQRWVVGAYDKRVAWKDWRAANYEPRQLGKRPPRTMHECGAEFREAVMP
jgi:hypothetical protein